MERFLGFILQKLAWLVTALVFILAGIFSNAHCQTATNLVKINGTPLPCGYPFATCTSTATRTPTPLPGASHTPTLIPTATATVTPTPQGEGPVYSQFGCVTITTSSPVTTIVRLPAGNPLFWLNSFYRPFAEGAGQASGVTIRRVFFGKNNEDGEYQLLASAAILTNPTAAPTPAIAHQIQNTGPYSQIMVVHDVGIGPTATITPWIDCLAGTSN